MPKPYKRHLPYISTDSTLIVPVRADEHHCYWKWDWDGKPGLTISKLLEGLNREDLIPSHNSRTVYEAEKVEAIEKKEVEKFKAVKRDGQLF